MPKLIPLEVKVRCFVLYMYGLGPLKISNLLTDAGYEDVPSTASIDAWANTGLLCEGVNWKLMRKAVQPVFDHLERHKYERTSARDYASWAEDTRSDLDKMQSEAMKAMSGMEFKPADFARIVATRQKMEDSTVERMEAIKAYLLSIGRILNGVAGIVQKKFQDPNVDRAMEFLLDRCVQEFEEFLRVGIANPKRITEGNYGLSGATGFVLEAGDTGEAETGL